MTKINFVMPPAGTRAKVIWPCAINVPKDNGEKQAQMLNVRFGVYTRDEREVAVEAAIAAQKPVQPALFDLVVDGFVDFRDQSGTVVSDEVAKRFFREIDYAVTGILAGFGEMMNGRPAALEKN